MSRCVQCQEWPCELLHRRESSLCAFTFKSFISATSVLVCTKCHPPFSHDSFLQMAEKDVKARERPTHFKTLEQQQQGKCLW